jgi:hypothetical protein
LPRNYLPEIRRLRQSRLMSPCAMQVRRRPQSRDQPHTAFIGRSFPGPGAPPSSSPKPHDPLLGKASCGERRFCVTATRSHGRVIGPWRPLPFGRRTTGPRMHSRSSRRQSRRRLRHCRYRARRSGSSPSPPRRHSGRASGAYSTELQIFFRGPIDNIQRHRVCLLR